MAQPIWITPAGSLGTLAEGVFFSKELGAFDPGPQQGNVTYVLIAGALPAGLQVNQNGIIAGVPTARLQGVPEQVSNDVTSKFTIRATSTFTGVTPPIVRIRDRTFSITITGDDKPEFITPAGSLGFFYDGDVINIQIQYTDTDPGDIVVVSKVGGQLPGGIEVSPTGLISGAIKPFTDVNEPPGYDITAQDVEPYDFLVNAISKNYQFTLQVTDGKSTSLRSFEFYVYNRQSLTADNTQITADNGQVTADETTVRAPYLINDAPSDLGIVRGDNYYAYQFIGNDYDTPVLRYAIAVNEGVGLPPGLELDPVTGWYYGYVPDVGVTEVEYSFNIVVYEADFAGTPIVCTATVFGTNRITCASTAQLGIGQPIVFTGTAFGGITASATTVYYVLNVVNATQFTITTRPDSTTAATLTNDSGTMEANLVVASDPYPFTVTISGAVDAEVIWNTPVNLGTIENGDTSLLQISATNRGGRVLSYRLASGDFNELPQGLELLPTGEISGRVSFNTFAIDLGRTTFDETTTWDSEFTFTVNAYAEDTEQLLYDVASITVVNGGSGYSSITPPVIAFSTPIGASAVAAQAGTVTVTGGAITNVAIANPGVGYSSPATVTITEGFGGSGAILQAVMQVTGVKDVVSVFRTFTVTVVRAYNEPYQNLVVQALPPVNDRALIDELLENDNIFVPEFIFRADDPYYGKATNVVYEHAFGLAPVIIDRYVESLYLNHYWKNLVLGSIRTAQATDAAGNVIYEVVYSQIIDNLVNNQGESVSKAVNLAYQIVDPLGQDVNVVYPNALVDMRDQVIDVVGQISTKLPLWMTSKQINGRILGFTPAWVICYTKPNRSRQIAYYIQTQFGERLNRVDFKVDRYTLDRALSENWDTLTQNWTPTPSLTTFDRFNTGVNTFVGTVDIATNLAFSDVNQRTLDYIQTLGGLDGEIDNINGNTIIFAKQQNYNGPPGSAYPTTVEAWQKYEQPYDSTGYSADNAPYDLAITIPGGDLIIASNTTAGTNVITLVAPYDTTELQPDQSIVFTTGVIGGIVSGTTYYILDILGSTTFRIKASLAATTPVTLSTASGTMTALPNNQRMGIWTITVNPGTDIVTLQLTQTTNINQFVQITRGNEYRSAQLRYPALPVAPLTRVNWQPLETVVSDETVFDAGSVAFIEPVDMYNPTDSEDKYLVFPKSNILV